MADASATVDTGAPARSLEALASRVAAAILAATGRLVRSRWWLLRVTLVAGAISLLHAAPAYDNVDPDHLNWRALERQADDPFEPHDYPPDSHAAKLALRLTVPLAGHVLGLGVTGFLVLNAIAGLVLLALTAHVAAGVTGDRVIGALTAIAVGLALAGSLGFTAMNGTIDAPALALVVAAMALRNPAAIAAAVVLAAFSDERAILAMGLVLLYHHMRALSWLNRQTIAVAAGMAGYVVLRAVVEHATGLDTPRGVIGVGMFFDQYVGGPIAAWSAFMALWALVLAGLVMLYLRRRLVDLAWALLATAMILFLAMLVGDTARSMTYALPVVFVALLALQPVRVAWTRALLVAICLVSLIPNYYVDQRREETHATMLLPAPLQVIRALAAD